METLSQMLGGLGLLGLVAAVLLAAAMLFILPWWAIIDCVRSRRGSDAKTVLVIGLVLTWGFGSLIYGLGTVALNPTVPISQDQRELFQLHYSSGKLVLLLPPLGDPANRIVVVDPATGEVSVPA